MADYWSDYWSDNWSEVTDAWERSLEHFLVTTRCWKLPGSYVEAARKQSD